jgi:DNA integrity scanning protein DisA with diadenylate cyclase activity
MEISSLTVLFRGVIGWKAVVDIVLIAAGLFFLYHTLLRLGTWRIVAGIMLAAFLFLIANFLDLKGLEWIFGNFSQVAVIALVVIFQPELRKIFERAASVRRFEIRDAGAELSHMIMDSLIKLAAQRRGAIVVLPGKEPIQEWLSGGFKLDAKPSIPLIMSIFDPNSPGHDGALIIQKGKFTRFGVRLPVSQSSKLPQNFRMNSARAIMRPWVCPKSRMRLRWSFPKNGEKYRYSAMVSFGSLMTLKNLWTPSLHTGNIPHRIPSNFLKEENDGWCSHKCLSAYAWRFFSGRHSS